MRCSVVFGVSSRLLVINILSSSLAINTAAYYQRCVITFEAVAVVHRRPCLHLACCIVMIVIISIFVAQLLFAFPLELVI